jgi:hypothetical protein
MVALVRRRRLRTGSAIALALAGHLLILGALGWRTPTVRPQTVTDSLPPVELSIMRLQAERPAAATAAKVPPRPSATSAPSATPTPASATTTAPARPSSLAGASGQPDCEVEDLPLLTDAERALCPDQIAADKARRLARERNARLAKQVASAKAAPPLDNIPAEKRAYYDAVAAAYDQQSHGPPMAGRHPEIHCTGIRPAHSLKIGALPCYVTPPQGFLTEESGVSPP